MDRLFVYGTLAPGRANHGVMEPIHGQWEPATLRGRLLDEGWGAEFGCPGIVPAEDADPVAGFLLSSDQLSTHWAMLDEYEGPGYKRVPVTVLTEGGDALPAFVYALNTSD